MGNFKTIEFLLPELHILGCLSHSLLLRREGDTQTLEQIQQARFRGPGVQCQTLINKRFLPDPNQQITLFHREVKGSIINRIFQHSFVALDGTIQLWIKSQAHRAGPHWTQASHREEQRQAEQDQNCDGTAAARKQQRPSFC